MIRRKKLSTSFQVLEIHTKKLFSDIHKGPFIILFENSVRYTHPKIAIIEGYLIFINSWLLEFNEIIEQKGLNIYRKKYRYHLMDKNKDLIFRYDNVPHFPDIDTHPDHKHVPHSVISSKAPTLRDVIKEIKELIAVKDSH